VWSAGLDRAGTVYPILMRLAGARAGRDCLGDPAARWPSPRHMYRLSGAGVRLAEELRKAAVAEVPRTRSAGSHQLPLGEAL
jgi:DNA-binding PadR family transcriptional regulator